MKFSDFDFLELASSTSSIILATVESLNSLVVFIFKTAPVLKQPLITSSPALTSLRALSPVRALVFRLEAPSTMMPSIGIFSPARTVIIVPISTSSGSTCSRVLPTSIFAYSGMISINSLMFLRLLPTA